MRQPQNRPKIDQGPPRNHQIRYPQIRVIAEDGSQLGIMSPRDAIRMALELGVDLIEVSAQATPPVCRIMDYGKYKYEMSKRNKEAAQKQRQAELKTITLKPLIGPHDLDVKIKHIKEFIEQGHKVKVVLQFRGRQMAHPEIGAQQINKIVAAVEEVGGGIDTPLSVVNKQMVITVGPKTAKTTS